MAGSFQHVINRDGSFIGRNGFTSQIENLRDAYEAIEEMYDMIVYLSGGDPRRISEAWREGHYRERMPYRIDQEPELFTDRAFWEDHELQGVPLTHQYRGKGRTTEQVKAAPQGAIYVWYSDRLHDARVFAVKAGRGDLVMVAPSWLSDRRWMGMRAPAIVVDHATKLTDEQRDLLVYARQQIRRR